MAKEKWFRMPFGVAKFTDLLIVKNKTQQSAETVYALYFIFGEMISDGAEKQKIFETAELITGSTEETISFVWQEIERRGLFLSGDDFLTNEARRKRDYRAGQSGTDLGQGGTEAGQGETGSGQDFSRPDTSQDKTRPDQKRPEEKRPPISPATPKAVDNSAAGSGSFSRIGDLVGRLSQGRAIVSEDTFLPDDWIDIRRDAPGWDPKVLIEKFNTRYEFNPPNNPRLAFKGWVPKFTKRKAP